MHRRSVITGLVASVTAGCIEPSSSNNPDTPPSNATNTPTETHNENSEQPTQTTQRPERKAIIEARWVEHVPKDSDIEPYPTGQKPVTDYELLLDLFDRAATADKWEPRGTRTPPKGPDVGEKVGESISLERGHEIQDEIDDIDNYTDANPSGHYFDHDDTLIVLRIVFQD